MTSHTVYIALGSNLDSPYKQIKSVLHELGQHPELKNIVCSSLYQSKPMAEMQQPDYINAVVRFQTKLSAIALLDELQALENKHGRERQAERWSARTLDLDILLYDDQVIDTKRLVIPHYGLKDRNFVLFPLSELDPNLKLPDNTKISDLIKQSSTEGLICLE